MANKNKIKQFNYTVVLIIKIIIIIMKRAKMKEIEWNNSLDNRK